MRGAPARARRQRQQPAQELVGHTGLQEAEVANRKLFETSGDAARLLEPSRRVLDDMPLPAGGAV
jgi:hypothetical protein